MSLDTQQKEKLFIKYGTGKEDSGSVYSQSVLFTERIKHLTEHLKNNRKDFGTQRSLQLMVGKRRKLLDYLKKKRYIILQKTSKGLKIKKIIYFKNDIKKGNYQKLPFLFYKQQRVKQKKK